MYLTLLHVIKGTINSCMYTYNVHVFVVSIDCTFIVFRLLFLDLKWQLKYLID